MAIPLNKTHVLSWSQKMNRSPIRNGERCTFKFNTNINFSRVWVLKYRFLEWPNALSKFYYQDFGT